MDDEGAGIRDDEVMRAMVWSIGGEDRQYDGGCSVVGGIL